MLRIYINICSKINYIIISCVLATTINTDYLVCLVATIRERTTLKKC